MMNPLAALTYGSRLTALVGQCLVLSPRMRLNTAGLKQCLQVYCMTRWQKKAAEKLWVSLAVRAVLGTQQQAAQLPPPQAPTRRPAPVVQPPVQGQLYPYPLPGAHGHGECIVS